jgi:hypothetical protein
VLFQVRIFHIPTPSEFFTPVVEAARSFSFEAQDYVTPVILNEVKDLLYNNLAICSLPSVQTAGSFALEAQDDVAETTALT